MKTLSDYIIFIKSFAVNFCSDISFRIAKKGYGIIGRLFWAAVIIISCWNIITIFLLMLKRFFSDSISIGVETTYLNWNSTYPAISFCLSKNRYYNEVSNFLRKHNISDIEMPNNYARTLHDLIFTNANNINIREENCKGLNSTCGVNISYVREQLIPRSCEDIMVDVEYKSHYDCLDIFKFHELEMGYCFLANNILDYGTIKNLPLKFERSDGRKTLKLFLKRSRFYNYEMYIHSSEDLPYFNSISYDSFSDPSLYSYNIEELLNDNDVFKESTKQRKCKFPNEILHGSSYHYSFSTCMTDLRINLELKMCNCTIYTAPSKFSMYYCDIKGLLCLSYTDVLSIAKEIVGTKYVCYPSCIEQQLTYVGSSDVKNVSRVGFYFVEIEVITSPTTRYKRVVTQTYLDLVVSVGGVIGLFIGASLINVIEVVYILIHYKRYSM